MKWLKTKEHGQAIMIVALMMVVLLGFIGLAVDGGELYLAQRRSRNAADAAMIAATYELCKTGGPESASVTGVKAAGENAALENGFDDANPDQRVEVRVGGTDTLETQGLPTGDTINQYVEVEIFQDSPTYLIQLVYPGPTEVTAMAVGRCQPETNSSSGFAVCLLDPNPTDGKGLEIGSSDGTITICYGDLGVNSTIQFSGGLTNVSCDPVECYEHVPDSFNPADCSADIVVPGGTGGITNASGGSYSSDSLQDGSCADDLADFPAPEGCDYTHPSQVSGTDVVNISDQNPSGDHNFVYCVPGLSANNTGDLIELNGPGIFKFTSAWTQTNGIIRVTDAMIYLDGVDFDASGGTLYMRAMKPETYPDELYRGMILFSSRGNTNDIRFTAGSSKTIFGTIYVPDALIDMSGGADDLLVTQLIAAELNLHGNADFRLYYDADWFFTFPPELKIGS